MKPVLTVVAASLAALAPAAALATVDSGEPGEQHALFRAGDLLQFGVPLAGFALTFALHEPGAGSGTAGGLSWGAGDALNVLALDGTPRHDFMAAALRMELTTYALKFSVDETRPNGGQHSFPSGHTASAFMGAEFIRKEYGWGWGVPAYLAASYVGWSRVASDNHWNRDVFAGAAIGVLSNHELPSLSGRYGTISVGPALIGPGSPAARFDGPEPGLTGAPETPGLGLQLHAQFGG